MDRDEGMGKVGHEHPRIAVSQRLRRKLQQVYNRSHNGRAVMRPWRLRQASRWKETAGAGRGGDGSDGGGVSQ